MAKGRLGAAPMAHMSIEDKATIRSESSGKESTRRDDDVVGDAQINQDK